MDSATARGCLEPREIEQVGRAAPGQLSPELVGHLASCSTCQKRLLALDAPEPAKRGKPDGDTSPGQRLLRVLLVLAAIIAALLTMLRLAR